MATEIIHGAYFAAAPLDHTTVDLSRLEQETTNITQQRCCLVHNIAAALLCGNAMPL